jgi:UDP-glucose 4-epimerase
VLITGACGFIGRHVAKHYAEAGSIVTGMGHGTWTRAEWSQWGLSSWRNASVNVENLLNSKAEPDVIVHCAGSGSVAFSISAPYQDFQRTVGSLLEVLEFARLHAPKAKIVYPSSASVYGNAKNLPIDETALLQPVSPYGVHKLIAEDLCRSYAKNFNLSVALVRFFSIYGAGLRKQLLWDACQKSLRGDISFFGTGDETRDWLHVKDAAILIAIAVNHASTDCPVVNGGNGVAVTVKETLEELFICLGRRDKPLFSGSSRSGDPVHYMASIKAAASWGWRPEVAWHDGIKEYASWFKSIPS